MSIITPIIVVVIALVITTIIPLIVVVVVVRIVATVDATSVTASVVVMIISSIPVVVATVGSAVTVITSIRSTVTIVVTAVAILVALGLLGFGGYPEGTLQLFALPHGIFGVTVQLTLVVHDHVEVTLEEGERSWWLYQIGFIGSLARPISPVVMILSVEVVHHYVLSVD
jgi:hypothetical protein